MATWIGRGFRASLGLGLFGLVLAGAGCSGATSGREDPLDPSPEKAEKGQNGQVGADGEVIDPGPITKGSMREHPAGRAWLFEAGAAPREVELGWAEARGYTVIDLSNGWVPYIFSSKTPGVDDASDNAFAARYVDLANDRTDDDGDPLAAHEHNYLELYGIPPTLRVIRDEWREVETDVQVCLDEAGYDPSVFSKGPSQIVFNRAGRKRVKRARWAKGTLDAAMKKAKIAGDYEAAAKNPKTERKYENWRALQDEVDIITMAQRRFRCEKLFNTHKGEGRYVEGDFDNATHHALAAFEKKHDIMGWGHFTAENLATLGQSAVESTHARLLRVLEERVVSAAGILEDGSAAKRKGAVWTDADGIEHDPRDLVSEFSQATVAALGLDTPESAREALDQLAGLGTGDFEDLLVAVKLPEKPAYYSSHMELEAIIDRGDVWYDYPFDDEGNRIPQPRRRKPHLTLYALYEGQRIPLIWWNTTIGSWRTEQEDGQEWYAYKNSDVGERVWKDIMAGPVWIPPKSTPVKTLTKRKYVDNKLQRVVNYDETGPGYKSAYGLVAAYHIRQVERSDGTVAELDNQIRTHGSVDYMSILRRYSHGCHRLYNMNAVRLFSFVLRHRDYVRNGQTDLGFARAFEYEGRELRMRLDTRGYNYELTPPIHVEVTEGRIRGKRKKPITEMMPKPGVDYSEEEVDEAAEGETAGIPTIPVPMPGEDAAE